MSEQATEIAPAPVVDLMAYDARGLPLLVVEVKSQPATAGAFEQVSQYQAMSYPLIPYGMIVDPIRIVVIHGSPEDVVATFSTPEVMERYDPEFSKKRIYPFYLKMLVESWLIDLKSHWKHDHPPGEEAWQAAGLLARLQGARIRDEVRLYGDPLR